MASATTLSMFADRSAWSSLQPCRECLAAALAACSAARRR